MARHYRNRNVPGVGMELGELGPLGTGGPANPGALMQRYRQMEQEGRLGPPRALAKRTFGLLGADERRMTPAPEAPYINRLRQRQWEARIPGLQRELASIEEGKFVPWGGGLSELGPTDTGGYHPGALRERLERLGKQGMLYRGGQDQPSTARNRELADPRVADWFTADPSGRPRFPASVMRPYRQEQARNLLPGVIANQARDQWSFSLPAAIQRGGWRGLIDPLRNANWAAAKPKWTRPFEVGLMKWGHEPWYRGPIPWPHFDEPSRRQERRPLPPRHIYRAPGEGLFNPANIPGVRPGRTRGRY